MIDLSERAANEPEMMDDFSIADERIEGALHALVQVNRWLGGYSSTESALHPIRQEAGPLYLLDIGAGIADYAVELVRRGDEHGQELHVEAIDANPHVVSYAQGYIERQLPPYLRSQITVKQANALNLPYETNAFDIAHAALFLHHLDPHDAVKLLREMQRVSRRGIIINDLHRHPLAYYGISLIANVFPAPEMFSHDGPLSVRRAFTRRDLQRLADQAGIEHYSLKWHWAFRWVLSSVTELDTDA